MVAERIKFEPLPQPRYTTLTVLFAHEAEVDRFVSQLADRNLSPQAVTIIGVALGEPPKRLATMANANTAHLKRYTQRGIVGGIVVALVVGVTLYRLNLWQLSFLESLLVYALALLTLGVVLGGATGAVLASLQTHDEVITLPPQNLEGFLVTLKIPSHLLPQGEALAREVGAKKLIA
jgi:hypothetical protein